ncbi:HIT domain-containing protein [Lysobacter enzymogenes]|uniref:Histidine triad protein n=1 Tax=Lysobacter enzymogenes TaxID=69 RepID=A0AAU9APP4_LYSEN|nr:HIT domain-containing protein [Lysobacter enzymogenes]BAV99572.1 histidine triad protein [Lysobacter enzymogenes]
MDCVFCRMLAGAAPASFVHRDQHVAAFVDLRQAVDGHVLIVPNRHVETLYELDEDTAGRLMALAVRVARALAADGAPPGLNLWQSNGHAGGQEVPHVHLHVQPRRVGDGLMRVYPNGVPAPSPRETLDALAARIAARL